MKQHLIRYELRICAVTSKSDLRIVEELWLCYSLWDVFIMSSMRMLNKLLRVFSFYCSKWFCQARSLNLRSIRTWHLAPLVYRIANVRSLDYEFGTAVCIREHKWQHVMMSQH